jgi:hypothetical protein
MTTPYSLRQFLSDSRFFWNHPVWEAMAGLRSLQWRLLHLEAELAVMRYFLERLRNDDLADWTEGNE